MKTPAMITLTRQDGQRAYRVSPCVIAWYAKHPAHDYTVVTLTTRSGGDSEVLTVRESEAELDALMAAAVADEVTT